jgi:uncharacterized membrane protein YphA (DoxX/SURF4 family)
MLNPFPDLLTYSLLAPFLLRVTIGFVLANLGYLKLTKEKGSWETIFKLLGLSGQKEIGTVIVGVVEIVGGIMLVVGFYTQIAALVFVILNGIEMFIEYHEETLMKRDMVFYLLIFVIALSLLFSGAGFLAFDLPL